jgi:hypothetical protein
MLPIAATSENGIMAKLLAPRLTTDEHILLGNFEMVYTRKPLPWLVSLQNRLSALG